MIQADLFSLESFPCTREPFEAAKAAGEKAMRAVAKKAETVAPDFSERARAFVLTYLGRHGISSGELITDACKLAGIRPHDDRAFGPVYAALARAGRIEFAGHCPRAKGHGTAGGRLWRLSTTPPGSP